MAQISDTAAGTNIGRGDEKLSFFAVSSGPVVQPTSANQAAIGAALVHAVGTADGTVADVGGAFNQGTLNDNFKELSTRSNEIRTLVNQIRTDLVALGLIKGS